MPPIIAITAPLNGNTVSGRIDVSADIMDDKGFRDTVFQIDGSPFSSILGASSKTEDTRSTILNTEGFDDGPHTLKVTIKDTVHQSSSDEVRIVINNGFDLPQEILAPVMGKFHIDTDSQTLPPEDWSFWQHKTGAHTVGAGIGNANDTSAWDMDLEKDTDAGKAVFSVSDGIVVEKYAGCENGGGEFGQVLIDHSGWWSGYLHLDDISVKPGDSVDENTQLGVISETGAATSHLHFVVYSGTNLTGCDNNPLEGGLESFNVTFIERGAFASDSNPVAEFAVLPVSGEVPVEVQFIDLSRPSSGSKITSWDWDFGNNGAKSEMQNPVHTYNNPGTFTVSLVVTDGNARIAKETKVDFISAKENITIQTPTPTPSPTVTLTPKPTPGAIGISALTVDKGTFVKSIRPQSVTVTAININGSPQAGATITAKANKRRVIVNPLSTKTGVDGTAKFNITFRPFTRNGHVVFSSGDASLTVNQKKSIFRKRPRN